MASARYLDILKQGFMKMPRSPSSKQSRGAPPAGERSVSCDRCSDWHPVGEHRDSVLEQEIGEVASGAAPRIRDLVVWKKIGPDDAGGARWQAAWIATPQTAEQRIAMLRRDSPGAEFVISVRRPQAT